MNRQTISSKRVRVLDDNPRRRKALRKNEVQQKVEELHRRKDQEQRGVFSFYLSLFFSPQAVLLQDVVKLSSEGWNLWRMPLRIL